jgi:hypothetical protein
MSGMDAQLNEVDLGALLHRTVAVTSPVGQTLSKAIPVEVNPA